MSALEVFERYGSFCRTGGTNRTFALEAFHSDPSILEPIVAEWGGDIISPPPSAKYRWTWRMYGKPAADLYHRHIRLGLSEAKRARGDRKLAECKNYYENEAIPSSDLREQPAS